MGTQPGGLEIPFALRLRVYALGVLLVFASVPFVHLYLAVELSAAELLIHASDIALSAALAAAVAELGISAWQAGFSWRMGSASSVLLLCATGLALLVLGPLFGTHDLLPHTDEIRRKHVESGYAEMSLRVLPITGLIGWLVYQAARLWTLRSELEEQRALNEALRLRSEGHGAEADESPRAEIRLTTDGGEVALPSDAIVRVQAQENYCEFVAQGRRPLLVRMTLAEARERLPADLFVQTHRSHVVNLSHVEEILREGRNAALRLRGGDQVPVARSRGAEVRARVRASL